MIIFCILALRFHIFGTRGWNIKYHLLNGQWITGTLAGKRPLGRPRRRWGDNIRIDLKETGINMRNSVDSGQYRDYWRTLVNAALNICVP